MVIIVATEESFNPYRKWLGIPIQEQPAHYYRLLGLEPFEGDSDAIVNAVDTKMAFLKGRLSGAQRSAAQQLMNELAEIQIVLLDPEKKAAYDQQLLILLSAKRPPSVETVPPLPSAAAASPILRRGRVILLLFFLAAGIVAGYLIVLPYINKAGRQAGSPVEKTVAISRREAKKNISAADGENFPHSPSSATTKKDNPTRPEEKGEIPRPTEKESDWEDMLFSPPPEVPDFVTPQEVLPKSVTSLPKEPKKEPKTAALDLSVKESTPLPEESPEAERREAEKAVRKVYEKRIAAAKSSREKLALAEEIWQEGAGTVGNPAERFALWRLALELTADAGRLHEALAEVKKLGEKYPGDAAAGKVEALCRVVQAYRAGEKSVNPLEIVALSPGAIEEARLAGCFEEAGRLLQLVTPLARLSKDQHLIRDLATQGREIEKLKAQSAAMRRAMDTLREHPDDMETRRLAGRWIAFQLQDWKRGLALLASSSDPTLGKLAAADLDHPHQPARQAELAGDYWEAAQKEPEILRRGILARAEYWYRRALPGSSEVAKIQVSKRLEEMEADRQTGKSVRGAVEPGNVALAKNGTRVEGVESGAAYLLDGQFSYGSAASSPLPCQWTITFPKIYQLQEIRFKLDERNPRNFFRYIAAVSADGINFQPVAIRTQGRWFGWQQARFPSQPVKAVRLAGVFASLSPRFMVNEFEAYCIPPNP